MKKRILAILLACMMVITAIPFSVFAESEECSHLQEDGSHRKSAMSEGDYEQVGDVVAPTCSEIGYTTYKCLECGAYFVDDVKAKDANNHVDTKEVVAVAPTCTKVGYTAGVRCEDCGKKISGCEEIKALGHDWVDASSSTVCSGEICSRCGAENPEDTTTEHNWSEHPTMTKEPTKDSTGEATYKCTNKGCNATRVVVIEKQCFHNIVKVKAVKAVKCSSGNSTVSDGLKEHYKCTLCEKLYSDAKGKNEITKKDVVIEADHKWVNQVVPAGCTTYGMEYQVCGVCGYSDESKITPIAPLGHTSYEEAKKVEGLVVKHPATCENPVYYTWTCQNDNCDVECKKVSTDEKDAAKGHKVETVTVAGTCANYGYTFTYCVADKWACDCKEVSTYTKTINKKDVVFDVTVEGEPVRLISFTLGEKDAANHDEKYVSSTTNYVAPTCTEAGSEFVYCENCEVYATVVIPAKGHNYGKSWTPISACKNDGYTQMKECSDCDYVLYDEDTKVTFSEIELNVIYDYTIEDLEKQHGYLWDDDALEEVTTINEGSCTVKGVKQYKCKYCGAQILLYIPGTGTHVAPEGTVVPPACQDYAGYDCKNCDAKNVGAREAIDCEKKVVLEAKAPTCTKEGNLKVEYCGICKTFTIYDEDGKVSSTYAQGNEKYDAALKFVKDNYAKVANPGHDWDKTAGKEATCATEGKNARWVCKTCEAVDETHNGETIPATGKHAWDSASTLNAAAGRTASCTEFGYTYHQCTVCKAEKINGIVKVLPHTLPEKADQPALKATCTEDGYTAHKKCANCDYTEGKEVVPATGHKNAAGETFYADCTKYNNVKDHKCVVCGDVKIAHAKQQKSDVIAPTCTEAGYTIWYCPACNEYTPDDVVEATGHDWEDKADWKYVAATESKAAYYVCECKACDETKNIDATDLTLHFEVENANGKDGFTDSSIVNVALMISGTSVDVAGLNFTINYDAKNLVFLGAEFGDVFNPANGGCLINDIKKTENKKEVSVGQLKVLATNMTAEGPKDVELENVAVLLNLQFRVASADASKAGSAEISIAAVEALKANGAVVENNTAPKATINFSQFMDFSLDAADGAVTLADAFSAYQMILGTLVDDNDTKDTKDDKVVTYDVALDVDKDGVITAADVTSIYQYIVGILTYDQMLALGTK